MVIIDIGDLPKCFVDMQKWNFLLDDSINSEKSNEISTSIQAAGKMTIDSNREDTESKNKIQDEIEIEPALEIESDFDSDNSDNQEIRLKSQKERIWSPPRIARIVRRIRAIGKGRIEEIWYRILFGFNQDDGDHMCKSQHANCNVTCTKEFCRNVNNDMMRCFNFRIEDIERTTAQIDMLQFFEQFTCKVSTCVAKSSALGNCREIETDTDNACFECWVDGRLEDLLQVMQLLKISNGQEISNEQINWMVVGQELDEIIFKIMNDKQGQYPVKWDKLAKVVRIFLLHLLNTEMSAILFQLVNEQGFYNEGELKMFLGGFEKGKLFHTIETCKKLIKQRSGNNNENVQEAVMIKSKNKNAKPLGDSEEAFLIKNCQYIASMDSRVMQQHGAVMTNEIQTEKFLISDPLLMKWTEKVEFKEMNNMIAQLADLGVKVGREMEIRMGLPKGIDEAGAANKGFGKDFWENFYENDDGTYGKMVIEKKEFKPEPFRRISICNKRKLHNIGLN